MSEIRESDSEGVYIVISQSHDGVEYSTGGIVHALLLGQESQQLSHVNTGCGSKEV